ncbi:MAG: hypothetical protein ACI9UK_002485 [Candidatus Krumholzibacteriia bacterium]
MDANGSGFHQFLILGFAVDQSFQGRAFVTHVLDQNGNVLPVGIFGEGQGYFLPASQFNKTRIGSVVISSAKAPARYS